MVIRQTRTTWLGSRAAWVTAGLAALALCLPGPMAAAPQDTEPVLTVSYEAYPVAGLDSPNTQPVNGAPNFEEALRVREKRLAADFSAPIVRGNARTALLALFGYRRYDLDLEHWSESQAGRPIKSPQVFEAGLSFRRLLTSGWLMRIDFLPGLHSDFEGEVGFGDLRLRGGMVFERTFKEDLHVTLGAGYTLAFGRGYPLPRVGVRWMMAPNVLVDLMLPERAALWYVPGERVAFGVATAVNGGSHHGDPDLYRVADPETRVAAGTFGPSLIVRATDHVRLRLDSGVTFFRSLALYDGGDELRSLDPKRTTFVRATAEIWR